AHLPLAIGAPDPRAISMYSRPPLLSLSPATDGIVSRVRGSVVLQAPRRIVETAIANGFFMAPKLPRAHRMRKNGRQRCGHAFCPEGLSSRPKGGTCS